jgi:hypothetical protein
MGIFQYSLLYACPQPGKIAERKVAVLGYMFLFKNIFISSTISLMFEYCWFLRCWYYSI